MTEQHEHSFLDEIEADSRGRVELALAHFSLRLEELFAAAVKARPSVSLDELASLMDVDRARIDRLLEGEDVLPAEAFVRYMRALGYTARVNAVPADHGVPELPHHLQEWDADFVDTYAQTAAGVHGVQTVRWTRSRTYTVGRLVPLEELKYIETIDTGSRRILSDEAAHQPVMDITKDDLMADEGGYSSVTYSHV